MITNTSIVSVNSFYYLSTVKRNSNFYWFRSWRSAESSEIAETSLLARNIKFKAYICEGMIRNWPLNTEYSVRNDHIYGLVRPLLQRYMKRHKNRAENVLRISLSTGISLNHKKIELYLDFLDERSAFDIYKVIQDHLPHSRKLYLKRRIQYH